MKHEEREIERKCVQLARRHGWDAWKNENNGNKGIPDYSFLKGGRFIMVEFKRSATAHIRPEQLTWVARHPETVFFCHDIETFMSILGITPKDFINNEIVDMLIEGTERECNKILGL